MHRYTRDSSVLDKHGETTFVDLHLHDMCSGVCFALPLFLGLLSVGDCLLAVSPSRSVESRHGPIAYCQYWAVCRIKLKSVSYGY